MDKIAHKNEKVSKDIILSIIICEIIILLPKLYVIAITIPITDIIDEVSMLSVPAYLAGYHWDNIMPYTRYYGVGYFAIFAPLFRLNISFVLIYKIMLIVTAIVEGIIPLILHNLLICHFGVYTKTKLILISTLVSFITVNPLYNLINEHMLIILMWLIVFFLIKLVCVKTTKQKFIYSILLSLVMIYGLFIHTRFIALVLTVISGLILYRIIFNEWVVNKIFFIILSIGYISANIAIKQIQNLVWGRTDLMNASVNIHMPQGDSIIGIIIGCIKVLLGNIGTMQYFYFSSVFLVLISLISLIYKNLREREITNESKIYFLVSVIFILCTGGTLFGLMLKNGQTFSNPIEDKSLYAIKFLTCLRYYVLYTSPLFFLWCVLLVNKQFIFEKIYKIAFLIDTLTLWTWLIYIAPDVADNDFGSSTFYPFSYLLGLNRNMSLSLENITGITILILNISILLVLLYRKFKNCNAIFIILASLFVYRYIYFVPNITIPSAEAKYERINSGVQYIEELDKSVNRVYVYSGDENLALLYQAYLYNIEIILGIPENPKSGDILLSNKSIDKMIDEREWMEINLDKNEWVYIKLDNQEDVFVNE